jgi:hypothetical protein
MAQFRGLLTSALNMLAGGRDFPIWYLLGNEPLHGSYKGCQELSDPLMRENMKHLMMKFREREGLSMNFLTKVNFLKNSMLLKRYDFFYKIALRGRRFEGTFWYKSRDDFEGEPNALFFTQSSNSIKSYGCLEMASLRPIDP